MSSKAYYSGTAGSSGTSKYGRKKRSLDTGSSIVYIGSSVGSNKEKKYSSSIGKVKSKGPVNHIPIFPYKRVP